MVHIVLVIAAVAHVRGMVVWQNGIEIKRVMNKLIQLSHFYTSHQMVFMERESAFFLRLEGGHFIKFFQHGVRLGLAAWILKTCFQADRPSSLTSGGAMTKRFLIIFFKPIAHAKLV